MSSYPTIDIQTTYPMINDQLDLPIYTDRLIIRALQSSDLLAYHSLLTDKGAMRNEPLSPDLSYTENVFPTPPGEAAEDDLWLGIFLKEPNNREGNLIGDGGVYYLLLSTEWPNLSDRIKEQYWNRGYATEFVRAFMRFWWRIPRHRQLKNLTIHPATLNAQDSPDQEVRERVYISVTHGNSANQKVLTKAGFEKFEGMGEGTTHWRQIREN